MSQGSASCQRSCTRIEADPCASWLSLRAGTIVRDVEGYIFNDTKVLKKLVSNALVQCVPWAATSIMARASTRLSARVCRGLASHVRHGAGRGNPRVCNRVRRIVLQLAGPSALHANAALPRTSECC